MYIREYPDFGDTNLLVKPVVLCDAGVNMFNVYVYGSVQKVRSRWRACPRRIVIITSLKNSHMLDEQLDTTGSCVLQTDRRHFSKDLLPIFFKRILVQKRWLHELQVNNGVVYLDYEDSHHHSPLLCSFQLLYRICLYCLMMYWFVFPFVGVPAWRLM